MATSYVVRRGRSVHHKADEKAPAKVYVQGQEIPVSGKEAERLLERGFIVKAGSPEAKVAEDAADAIPADFPGRDELVKAGYETLSAVKADAAHIGDVKGIGAKTADAIRKAVGA